MPIRVLVVEDEADIRRLVQIKLKAAGFDVAVAEDGADGFQQAVATKPDVLLCDIMMPGKDGYTLVRELREQYADDPPIIIMLTAKGQDEDVARGLSAGADDYIIKPFAPRELVARIRVAVIKSGRQLEVPAAE